MGAKQFGWQVEVVSWDLLGLAECGLGFDIMVAESWILHQSDTRDWGLWIYHEWGSLLIEHRCYKVIDGPPILERPTYNHNSTIEQPSEWLNPAQITATPCSKITAQGLECIGTGPKRTHNVEGVQGLIYVTPTLSIATI